MSGLPPHRHAGSGPAPGERRRSLRRFAVAVLVVLVAGFGAGTLFGRTDPQRAARLVVAELTVTEDGPPDAPGPDPRTPVTGPHRGEPVCGRLTEPLDPAAQVATLAAGVVLLQHPPDPGAAAEAVLASLAERDRVAVAPSDHLAAGTAVVATAWRKRMPLERVERELLDAFVTGHADRAPALAPCP